MYICKQRYSGRHILAACCVIAANCQYLAAKTELSYTAVQTVIPYHNLHSDETYKMACQGFIESCTTMLYLAWRKFGVVSAPHKRKDIAAK